MTSQEAARLGFLVAELADQGKLTITKIDAQYHVGHNTSAWHTAAGRNCVGPDLLPAMEQMQSRVTAS